jgi:hypothetical protein
MSGMQFTSNLITVLAWPVVVLFVLIVYRRWITSTISSVTAGVKLRRVKAGPVEVEWDAAIDAAGRDVGGALSQMPVPSGDGPVPTSLVDLIDQVNKNPRAGIRAAFNLVLRALEQSYPELAAVAPYRLQGAMQDLVRRGVLSAEVERSVSQLYQLLEISQLSTDVADQTQGYEFLMLAEGAIHTILRSAGTQASGDYDDARNGSESTPIEPSWRGIYNNSYPIELRIREWKENNFEGLMSYPNSGTITRVTGRVEPSSRDGAPVTVRWEETGYAQQGGRPIDLNGYYQATVSGDTMTGQWYQGTRLVAGFEMAAIVTGTTADLMLKPPGP